MAYNRRKTSRSGYDSNSNNSGGRIKDRKKRHGYRKFTHQKSGKQYISGWFVDRKSGLVKILCCVNKYSDEVCSNGATKLTAIITWPSIGEKKLFNAFLQTSGAVTIPDLNIVLSPNGREGSYTGYMFNGK